MFTKINEIFFAYEFEEILNEKLWRPKKWFLFFTQVPNVQELLDYWSTSDGESKIKEGLSYTDEVMRRLFPEHRQIAEAKDRVVKEVRNS